MIKQYIKMAGFTDRTLRKNLVITGTNKMTSKCPRMTSRAFFTVGNIFYCPEK